jgi:FSR family fosmidomycin resistance protein-like MFS transporter
VEPVLGVLGDGRARRAIVLAGGAACAGSLVAVAAAPAFAPLLLAFCVLWPASGAFVSLSQATLMDLDSGAHERNMARWTLVGSVGVVAGPLLLTAVLVLGGDWRAALGGLAGLGLALAWVSRRVPHAGAGEAEPLLHGLRRALRELRRREVLRWLAVLELADLLLDVLLGFLALYFVDVVGVSPATGGLAIAVWTGAGLVGDALLLPLLRRVDGLRWLRATAAAAVVVLPLFLLAPGLPLKLALLAVLGVSNSGWYAIPQARLYSELGSRSGTVVALTSVAGLAGAALPLGIGLLAQAVGLGPALWALLAGPAALLLLVPRR